MAGTAVRAAEPEPPTLDASTPCTACGRPIGEHGWIVAGGRGVYCDSCMAHSTPCSACGAPCRTIVLRDGRVFCPECAASLVSDPATVEAIYQDAVAAAEEKLGLRLAVRPTLLLQPLAALRHDAGPDSTPETLCGLCTRDRHGAYTIRILVPLPRARLFAVLGHELGHAWQGVHCPDAQGTRLREGFAEWVSWHVLAGREGCETERRVIEKRTDLYGQGFRMFAELEAHGGAGRALWYAQAAETRTLADVLPQKSRR